MPTGIEILKSGLIFGDFSNQGNFTFQVKVSSGKDSSAWKDITIEVKNQSEQKSYQKNTRVILPPPLIVDSLPPAKPLQIKNYRKIYGFKVVDTKNLQSGFLTIENNQLQKPQLSGTYEIRDEFNDKLLAKGEVLGVSYYRIVFKNVFNYASERELKKAKVYIYRKSL